MHYFFGFDIGYGTVIKRYYFLAEFKAYSPISFGILRFETFANPLNSTVLFTSWTTRPFFSSSIKSTPKIPPPTALEAFAQTSSISLVISHSSGSAPNAMFVLKPPDDFLYMADMA